LICSLQNTVLALVHLLLRSCFLEQSWKGRLHCVVKGIWHQSEPAREISRIASVHVWFPKLDAVGSSGTACVGSVAFSHVCALRKVSECRGFIAERCGDGQWKPVALPFIKFFNLGDDRAADFDWSCFSTYEKLDGMMVV
jgi:hypothetical protein